MGNTTKYSLIGALLILAAFLVNLIYLYWQISPAFQFLIQIITTVLVSGGISLIMIALVQSKNLEIYLRNAAEKIVEESTSNLDKKFELLQHCVDNGLYDILPPRQDKDNGNVTREIISNEIMDSRETKIISITGIDCFDYSRGTGGAKPCYTMVYEKLGELESKGELVDFNIQVLLIDPDSEAAIFRNQIESFDNKKPNLVKDILTSIEGISKLNLVHHNESLKSYKMSRM